MTTVSSITTKDKKHAEWPANPLVNMEGLILQFMKKLDGDEVVEEKKLKKKMVSQFAEAQSIDKDEAKKAYKSAFASLLSDGELESNEGNIRLVVVEKVSSKKRKAVDEETEPVAPATANNTKTSKRDSSQKVKNTIHVEKYPELWKNGEQHWRDGTLDQEYLRTNPDKVTRLFCGNLNKKVTEEELKNCISGITYIKWITDKESGEFYGTSYLEMKDSSAAAVAVAQDKSKFMGRPLKIYYCPARPGDKWPPVREYPSGGKSSTDGGDGCAKSSNNSSNAPPRREATPKPEGCKKLYAGNLSYNIDDESIVEFFKECGEIVGLRWLTHQSSGEFRGCGFIEFSKSEEADLAIKLNGKEVLGRPIILDWTN